MEYKRNKTLEALAKENAQRIPGELPPMGK